MRFINFETKNRETSLALRGPSRDSVTESVTNSVAFARSKAKILDNKKENMLNMIDSLLRRNQEGNDEDDVLIGGDDDPEDVTTADMF